MFIYRNLTTGKWQYGEKPKAAVKGVDGKPLRFNAVLARNVTFKLSEASRQRCLRNLADPKSKYGWDVHAYAVGDVVASTVDGWLDPLAHGMPAEPVAITYDKAGTGQFIRKDTRQPITACDWVLFAEDGHTYARGVR